MGTAGKHGGCVGRKEGQCSSSSVRSQGIRRQCRWLSDAWGRCTSRLQTQTLQQQTLQHQALQRDASQASISKTYKFCNRVECSWRA